MSTAFNLTAQLNLRGPTNVRNIVSGIRRQLGNITADVNLRIDPAASRNLTQLNTALTNFNRTLRTTQTNAATTANALRGLANAINGINANNLPRNMTNIATASNRAAQATGRVTQQVGQARNQMEEFGRQSALAVRRFAAFSISAGIIVGFTNAVNKGVRAFIEFDKELVKLQQVTGESAKGLSGLRKTIGDLASGLGVSSSELINVSSTLAQAGLSARDTEKALKALALSSLAPSFDDMNKTVEGSIALMRQFGISAGELDQALGSVNAVAAKFAVEASDIIAAIQRTGGVFAAASKGVSEGTNALNEFIAVFTSIRATTRESAETIATGLRTIFTRVQRGETIEALKQYGVNLTDLEGKFVGAYKAVELLSRGLNQIDPRDLRFSQIVEELGGFRQIGKVIPLIQQFATAQQALAVAQRGQGSLAEDAAIAQLSLANQIAKVREEFLTLIRDIGGTDTFQTIAKSALGLASALIKVADSVKGVLPVLGVVMAIRGTAALSSYARGFAGGMGGMRGAGGRRAAGGGYIRYATGGEVPVALMPGEAVIYPQAAKRIGTPTLRRMNYADKKMAKGGKVGMVPGSGNSDSFYTSLPAGSFVIRKKATQAMGVGRINDIASGRQKFAVGGEAKWRDVEAQMRGGRGRPSKKTTTVGEAVDKISSKEYNNRKGRFKSDFPFIIRGLNRAGTKAQINEEAILDKYLKKGVNDLSKAIVNQTQGNITVPSGDIDIQNKESIYGGLFETALLKISQRSADKKDNSQNFDFPRGIGPILSNIFSGMPPSISTDVKRTAAANAGMKSNIANKLANEMASNRLPKQPMPVGVVSLSPMDSAIVSKISGAEVNKLLNSKIKQKNKSQRRAIGGLIQKFAKGGLTTRNVGYIDSDEITQLLKDSVKGPLIKAEMDRLGIKGVADYKEHLSNLAATRRNDGSLKRLTNIFGVAGSGKSTMVQGGARAAEADNARLRKTNRFPILTEQDLLRSDQVIDSTSVAGPSQRTALSAADRVVALSSRTKESQEALKKNRKSRDTSGRNLFGRRPGATKSAPLDSGIGEAYIAASGVSGVDPKKVVTMKLGEKFRKTRTSQPTVRTPDKTGLFYGNFGPTTKGHTSVVKEAEKMGIPAKDFVALVGGDTPIDYTDKDPHSRRTAIFPQKSSDQLPSRLGMARAAFGAMGANVSAMPKGSGPGSIPSAFKVGEDSYIVPKGKGDIAFVGDEKEAGSLSKYEKLGYGVKSLPRSGGISGTKAREAIAANDIPALKKLLSPAGFEYVQKHMAVLQQRPKLLDAILSKIERNSAAGKGTAGRLSQVKSQLADLPSRMSKTTPADVVAKVESLRKERDALSSKVGRLPSKLMSRLEQRQKFGIGDEVKSKKKVKKINPNDYSQSIQNLQSDPNSILRQNAVGVAILQGPKKGVADSSVSKKSIIQSVGKQYSDLLGSAVAGGSIGIQREALKPQVYKDFNEGIENGLVQAVNTAVSTISSKYPDLPTPAINGEEERRKYLKGVNDAAKGNMFEEMLTSMRNKGQYDANPDPQRSFDFAPNKGSAFGLSNIFDKISSLLYVDAKASSPSDAAMSKKIANQTLRDLGVIKGRKSKDAPDQASLEKDITQRLRLVTEDSPLSLQDLQKELPNAKLKMANSIAKSMGLEVDRAGGRTNFIRRRIARALGGEIPNSKQINKASLAVQSKRKLSGSEMIKAARYAGYDIERLDNGKILLSRNGKKMHELDDDQTSQMLGSIMTGHKATGLVDRFAKGGEVPILAQEGEYVINRKSARAIGYNNLHSLNKYHTGGVVQKLAKGSNSPLANTNIVSGLEKDAKLLGVSLKQLLNAFKANRDKFYAEAKASGRSNAQATKYANERTAGTYKDMLFRRTGKETRSQELRNNRTAGSAVKQLDKGGYLTGNNPVKTPKGLDAKKIEAVEQDIGRVFGQLENTFDKLVNAGERTSKILRRQANQKAKDAADQARQKATAAGASDADAERAARKAFSSTRSKEMKAMSQRVRTKQSQADAKLEQLGVQTTDATGKRLTRKQIQENAGRALDLNKKAIEGRKESLVRSRFQALQQDNPGRIQSLRNAVSNRLTGGNAPTRRTDASLMAQARKEVEKILQLETKRANETAKQLANERAKTNASAKGKATASAGGAAAAAGGTVVAGGGGGSGGGSGGRRRRSSGRGSSGDGSGGGGNGRIMGMGRLTQAGFGISMMGGLGSQFFNPESSASNAANAAFTESLTSTIGMGATIAGSIGDLFGGGGDDDPPRNRRNRSSGRGSRNRGPSTRTRPPGGGGGGGGGGGRGGSGGSGSRSSRRGGGAPRVPTGGGGAGGGGGGITGMLGGVGTALAGVAVVGLAVAEGLKAAHNAAREFAINLANTKLEESLEKANKSIEKFSNNLTDKAVESQAKNATLSAVKAADTLNAASNKPEAGLFNLVDAMSGGSGSFERSQILNKQGIGAYLSTTSLFGGVNAAGNQEAQFQSLIPQLASERSKRFTGAAEASASFIESKVKSGSSLDQMQAEMKPEEFNNLTKSLALADAAVQEQIMTIQNSTAMTQGQKDALIASTVAAEAERKARDIQTKALRDKALEKLNKTTNMLQNSLERMFQNMDQAISANVAALDKLSNQADLTTASLSGQAKIGTNLQLDSINVLDNPRAYGNQANQMAVSQASSIFGSEANKMSGLLQLGNKLEGSLMATINNTLKDNKGATNESVGAKLESVITNAMTDLQIPDDVALNLGKEMSTAIQEMRKKGEDKVDFSELTERIPQLSKVVESSKRAHEIAKRALEQWQGAVNEYASAINQITEMQVEASARSRRANSIMIQGQTDLQRALGKEISLREAKNNTLQGFSDQTGGLSDPRAIGRNIRNLEGVRAEQQSLYNAAGNKGPGATGEVQMMGDQLLRTNTALRENYDALKNMADNTDIASAALNKISEIRQQRQAGVGFAEKLVSSTPKELANLNMSMARLQNNMAGRMNISNPSQRAGDLQLFNELAPLLGDRQSEMKANVLENMLKESGVGVSPMMQEVIDSLRNPEADPAMQEAINTYKEGVALQSKANTELSNISMLMAQNNADIAAQKLTESLQRVTLNFESQNLSEINQGIKLLIAEVKANNGGGMGGAPAQTKARGGLIYANEGTLIDFKPKGSDTVPAMLTPGEFVVNKKATQNNLGLLKQINSGSYSSGGKVKYYADGGYVFDKTWSPTIDDKESPEDAQARAKGKYEDKAYNETKNYLPGLNWEVLDKPIDKIKYFAANKPGLYAVNSQAEMLTDWISTTSPSALADTSVKSAGLSWNIGQGYQSFSLIEGGSAVDLGGNSPQYGADKVTYEKKWLGLQNIVPSNAGSWIDIEAPSQKWTDSITSPAAKLLKVKQTEAAAFQTKINNLMGLLKPTADNPDYLEYDGKKLYKDISKFTGKDKPNIKLDFIKGPAKAYIDRVSIDRDGKEEKEFIETDEIRFNKIRQIRVSGLAADSDIDGAAFLLTGTQKDTPKAKGNFIAARQDTAGLQYGLELATMGITSLTRAAGDYALGADIDAATGGSLSTAITAGETASQNIAGSNNIGAMLGRRIRPMYNDSFAQNTANNLGYLAKLDMIRARLKTALEQLGDPGSFAQSETSNADQEYARKLQALVNGLVFKNTFSDTEIKPKKGKGPYTLFNLTTPDDINFFKTTAEAVERSKGADAGSYSAQQADFIPVFKTNIAGGLDLVKAFPWINAGFRDVSAFNQKELQRNTDKTQAKIKVTNGLFAGKHISFPYRTIESEVGLWDKKTNRFDNTRQVFDIIDAGGGLDKNNPNPFNELLLPNFSSIRTANAKNLGALIEQQAMANQGKKFTLATTDAYIASKMDPASAELSTSGITDNITKNNVFMPVDTAYKPEWVTEQFAERFLAKQKKAKEENNAAAAGQADVGKEFKQKLTPAQRTSLARVLHKVALKNRVGMLGSVPAKQEDIYRNIELLGRMMSMPGVNNEVAARASAARYLFSTILNDSGSKLSGMLSSQGLDLNTMFTIPAGMIQRVSRKKVAKDGFKNKELQDMYYQLIPDAQKKLEALFQTLMDAESSGAKFRQFNTANKLDEQTQNQLKLEGAKIAQVNPKTGEVTYTSAKETIPKSYQEIANIALNPFNRFPDAIARKSYLDKLSEVVMNAKGPNRQPLYKGKMQEKIAQDLATLKQFYVGEGLANFKGLDYYTNTSSKAADVAKEWEALVGSQQIAEFEDLYKKAQEAHFFLTANSMGMLPNREKLSAMLATNATEAAKKPKMAARGGVIYASTGTLVDYQPRGTDTVPAMLTPGEFVINKQATRRNLPLLKAINSNRYQTGGIVQPQYHDIGNMVSGASKAVGAMAGAIGIKLDTGKLETEMNKILSDGAKLLAGALQLSGQDRNALTTFGDNFKSLLSQMSQINIPPEIRFSMQPVQVNITGAQGLTDAAQSLIDGAIKKAFNNFLSINDLQGTYKAP